MFRTTRLGLLLGFAFLTGLGMGPLLDMAIMLNPSLVPSAFMLTSIVFAGFTGAALFARDGKYLYLGGSLISGRVIVTVCQRNFFLPERAAGLAELKSAPLYMHFFYYC